MKKIIILLMTCLTISAQAAPKNFYSAKKILSTEIYSDIDNSFYCGCDLFYEEKNKLKPNHSSCGFEHRKNFKRSSRIEWEHVKSAWSFGHQRLCWQKGGRKECSKDPIFELMEADLHNLVPAIGEVNGDRSNFKLTMLSGSTYKDQYGQCDMVVDFKQKKAMPTESIRGDIARINFYMADKYNLTLSQQDINIYRAWHNSDPVSDNELRIHNKKAKFQGNENPFVTGKKDPRDYKNKTKQLEIEEESENKLLDVISTNNNFQNNNSCGSKKYCKDMSSCEEAKFYLNSCGLSNLDRNKDGVPCESLCK